MYHTGQGMMWLTVLQLAPEPSDVPDSLSCLVSVISGTAFEHCLCGLLMVNKALVNESQLINLSMLSLPEKYIFM